MSSDSAITIVHAGLLALLVDSGRRGIQHFGFCESGPMDDKAFFWANWLCKNSLDNPVIEAVGGLEVEALKDLTVAVTGPEISVLINGCRESPWRTLRLKRGETLSINAERTGTKSYLAVAGQWQIAKVAGSISTVRRESLGGLTGNGKPLQKHDCIDIAGTHKVPGQEVPASLRPCYSLALPLDVITGYQCNRFPPMSVNRFFNENYRLTNEVDRMGFRLAGYSVTGAPPSMRSEGINLGSIQIPPDGQPIIMMRDRQTLGGYPKIGCVASYDIHRLAQAVPGDNLFFVPIDPHNARAKWLLNKQQLVRTIQSIEKQL